MSTEENKALARRYWEEVLNQHNLAAVDQLVAPNFVGHFSALPKEPKEVQDLEPVKQVLSMYLTALPDIQLTIVDMIAEGDTVVFRHTFRGTHKGDIMGIPPTDKQVNVTGIDIFRIVEGKIVEQWTNADDLGAMQQLGVVPSMG
jgi:steroid delta-isomerase-like uncharacterized protein